MRPGRWAPRAGPKYWNGAQCHKHLVRAAGCTRNSYRPGMSPAGSRISRGGAHPATSGRLWHPPLCQKVVLGDPSTGRGGPLTQAGLPRWQSSHGLRRGQRRRDDTLPDQSGLALGPRSCSYAQGGRRVGMSLQFAVGKGRHGESHAAGMGFLRGARRRPWWRCSRCRV